MHELLTSRDSQIKGADNVPLPGIRRHDVGWPHTRETLGANGQESAALV